MAPSSRAVAHKTKLMRGAVGLPLDDWTDRHPHQSYRVNHLAQSFGDIAQNGVLEERSVKVPLIFSLGYPPFSQGFDPAGSAAQRSIPVTASSSSSRLSDVKFFCCDKPESDLPRPARNSAQRASGSASGRRLRVPSSAADRLPACPRSRATGAPLAVLLQCRTRDIKSHEVSISHSIHTIVHMPFQGGGGIIPGLVG
jgi:hypothetical protein